MAAMRTGRTMAAWRAQRWPALLAIACAAGCGVRDPGENFHSPVPEKRAAAIARLTKPDGDKSLPMLLVAEHDPSALVRKTLAGVLTARGGPRSLESLGTLLQDTDPDVVAAAARGLGTLGTSEKSRDPVRTILVGAYWRGSPDGREEIANALQGIGISLREAVELEARHLWDRNLMALALGGPASRGAAEEIGRSGRREAVARLLPLVQSETPSDVALVAAAARGLGQAGDREVRPILEELLDGDDLRLREAAAESLGMLGDVSASTSLSDAGLGGPLRFMAAVIEALAALPNAPDVGTALCTMSVGVPDAGLAVRAARLARLRDVECQEKALLTRIRGKGPETAAALAALAAVGVPSGRAKESASRVLPLLDNKAAGPEIRGLAARALGELGAANAIPQLWSRAKNLAEERARAAAQRKAGTADDGADGEEDSKKELQEAEASGEELGGLAVALARLHADGIGPFLEGLLSDSDEAVRASAIEAMGVLGGEQAKARQEAVLADPSARVRTAAAAGLGRLGAAGVPGLSAAVKKSRPADVEWRSVLARSLGDTGSPQAVAPLAQLLLGGSAATAASALGRLGAKEGAAPLLEHLGDPKALGQVESLEALGQVAGADAGPVLATALASDRPEVRAAAARSLGRIKYEPASPRLEALRSDYYGEVRRAAVEALAKLPAPGPGR